jgi:hypothetical protein
MSVEPMRMIHNYGTDILVKQDRRENFLAVASPVFWQPKPLHLNLGNGVIDSLCHFAQVCVR